ncbi:MAG: hypothetical protein GWO24_16870 [Akkermansiaceae bacterium]|nr:hypothetical protein [Akkermansiaceae bacterium]
MGKWKDPRFTGTRVPTFREVAAVVPEGKKFYIEVKCGTEIVPRLLSEIDESKLRDEQIVVISFHSDVIAEIKNRRPEWIANWLYAFDSKKPDSPNEKMPELLRTLKSIRADGLSSNAHPGIARAHLARLREAGFQHHVWTVNDATTARRFLDLGTQSVTTDFPGRLRKALHNR